MFCPTKRPGARETAGAEGPFVQPLDGGVVGGRFQVEVERQVGHGCATSAKGRQDQGLAENHAARRRRWMLKVRPEIMMGRIACGIAAVICSRTGGC